MVRCFELYGWDPKKPRCGVYRQLLILPRLPQRGLEVRCYHQDRELALFQFVGDLLRSIALPVFFRRRIIATLQETTRFLRANDDRYRAFLATFLGTDFIRRHRLDLSCTRFHVNGVSYLRVVGFGAIVLSFFAL